MQYSPQKISLIKTGKYADFKQKQKDQWRSDQIPTDDPSFYGLTEDEMRLIKQLDLSTRRKKAEFRKHVSFMRDHYDNLGFLTLTWSDQTINESNFTTKQKQVARCLFACFPDYIGRFEISSKGRIHFHGIVAWNGIVATRLTQNFSRKLVTNKTDLTEHWIKYGIYDLVLINKVEENTNQTSNYVLKSLNTMESYIEKNEVSFECDLDDQLIVEVNTSNTLVKRGSAYQKWKKDDQAENKTLRSTARAFDQTFYDQNKFNGNSAFKTWFYESRNKNISLPVGTYKPMFDPHFSLINPNSYVLQSESSDDLEELPFY